MVICHEPLTYGVCGRDVEAGLKWYDERHPTAKIPNQKRMAVVVDRKLTVYRYHSNWDPAPVYGMTEALARALALGEQYVGEAVVRTYTVAPIRLRDFARRACQALKSGPIRVIGDPDRSVSRIALCYGGFGQMFTFAEVALEQNAELAVFGEMLDYTIRYCVECGLAAIELGHFRSEQPGIEAMAEYLRRNVPAQTPVRCISSDEPWYYIGC